MKIFLILFLVSFNCFSMTCIQAKSEFTRLRKKELSQADKALYTEKKTVVDEVKALNEPTSEQLNSALEAKRVMQELETKLILTNVERSVLNQAVSKMGSCWNLNL